METEVARKHPIAIVGLGCVLPDAPDVTAFWNNLLEGKSSIREVSATRWDTSLFWSEDHDAPDKTYAKIGAFVEDDAFDGLDYRMPPKVVEQIDPSQRWALAATRQAFKDAGYATGLKGDQGRDFDRARCGVILGNAMGGEQMKLQTKRLYWPQVEHSLRGDPDMQGLPADKQEAIIQRAEERFKAGVPAITEDSMPGTLSNVAAGRIANVFDLHGKNFTTDAACASSLAALDAAIDALQDGECDTVVCGGTDRSMDITPYVEFSKIGALSADGSRPFDKHANGFVMGEGCAIFILKRLADAERDGDHIHAVIRGIGASSDGKGKGITAPNPRGQVQAVRRAYEDAGIDPTTIGYLEAHGTSTPVGDPVELQSVMDAFQQITEVRLPSGAIKVGSVKSNMGHLKSAAGAVGMLKAVLALEHGVIPPSINVQELNPRIDWKQSVFSVATARQDWPAPPGIPRRAAVSSFGFGGTNFHVVMEQHVPGRLLAPDGTMQPHARDTAAAPRAAGLDTAAFAAHMEKAAGLEGEPLVLDGDRAADIAAGIPQEIAYTRTGAGPRLRDVLHPITSAGVQADRRLGMHLGDPAELPKKLALAKKAMAEPAAARLAFAQGVFLNEGAPQGKVAFLFPGQGTQYVNMLRDLAEKYEVVRNTFHEADEVLYDDLGGVKLTDILWPTPDTPEARQAAEEKLKLTEFTQPAVLAADTAVLRLLQQWGIKPDVVAGHSLGEYGALVAAGVLSFADALHAVAARGREMANVEVPDLGKMAAVPSDWETVQEAIRDVEGYVIPANKNCSSQTVLAGSSAGVDAAVAQLKERGLQAQYLPVSAAFHSEIVAPASAPLRKVLARLDVNPPRVRTLSNVGAAPYGDDPEAIRDNLAVQVASPVEWIGIIERMYDEGVRVFVEVGPKKALTGFCQDILKDKDAVAICANHPKKGGIAHINELFAFLGAWGFAPRVPALDDPSVYTVAHRDPKAMFTTHASTTVPRADPRLDVIADGLRGLVRQLDEMRGDDPQATTAPAATPPAATLPAATAPPTPQAPVAVAPEDEEALLLGKRAKAFGIDLGDIGISGISVGLPGKDKPLFDEGDWDRVLRGENLIDPLTEPEREKLAGKHIVRLVKTGGGDARFEAVNDIAQVIQLAGQRGGFDVSEWGVDGDFAGTLDRTFQYAIAAGLEALRDAGIPLQRTYMKTSTGSWLPKDWKLPEPMRDGTGIVFASAFPGYDNLIRDISRFLADKYAGSSLDELQALYDELLGAIQDEELRTKAQDLFDARFERLQDVLPDHGAARYEFNRKFLFSVLSMGHAQLAQFIGARGPNTQVNAACASTTQAISIAEDWIRTGRCDRVLVVGADDVTSDAMFEWIGSGFLASGAATTKANVADAALPFDARRHGMIVGMGAVGLVIEAARETEARGMRPIARLLATEVANSAYHGSRLDVSHISDCMTRLAAKAEARYGVRAGEIADHTVFMSHETYTPARGGSASAEIHALRATFGDQANRVVIANTKGFTGHPQGAGVEDAIVLKCLQRGEVPPIANFRDPDPELGDLNLSRGGKQDVRYALRLAAGFGSQVAMTLTELVAREHERVADADRYAAWLGEVSGQPGATAHVEQRTLRIVDTGPPPRAEARPVAPVEEAAPSVPASVPASSEGLDEQVVLDRLVALVAEKTGYPTEMLDPDMDMEADLGIDTVKQAELFGMMREEYGVPLEEGLQIKDYPTLRAVAGYMTSRAAPAPTPAAPAAPDAALDAAPDAAPASPDAAPAQAAGTPLPASAVLDRLVALVADKTGYPTDMLDPDMDMEADLGIDTVKQAELFGMMREEYGVPLEDGLQIKDYPTLRAVAGYMADRAGGPANGVTNAAPEATTVQDTAPDAATRQDTAAETAPADAATQTVDPPSQDAEHPRVPSETKQTLLAVDAPAGLDEGLALRRLTTLVAEKTGYPAEMLEPDLDMEADLGIDTVKQAELFGMMRDEFQVPLEDGLQIKDYPTLRAVAGYMAARAGGALSTGTTVGTNAVEEDAVEEDAVEEDATVATEANEADTAVEASPFVAAPAAPLPAETDASAVDEDEVLARLIELVAEKTGYPAEMLEPDLDMEADLGIDTVKQAELFGVMRDAYDVPLEDGLQIKDYPTLRAVAGYMASRSGTTVDAGTPDVAADTEGPADAAVAGAETPDEAAAEAAPTGTATPAVEAPGPEEAQVGDAEPAEADAIVRRVPIPRGESLPGQGPALERGTVLVVGDDDADVRRAFDEQGFTTTFNVQDGAIVGLLCIATRPAPEKAGQRLGDLFDAAKAHRGRFTSGRFVCVVTAQDGAHGLQAPRDAGMAGLAGLGKSLRKEFPEALVKCIDVAPGLKAGRAVASELLYGGTRTEVAYDAQGARLVIDVGPEELEDAVPDVAGKHLVVSGGAQGITTEMLLALAPQGPRLLLLGRTELPDEAATWAAYDDDAWQAAGHEAMARLKEAGERVTPVAVEKALAPMRKAAEVHQNVTRLREAGAEVVYRAIDVTDAASVRRAVLQARKRFGKVHGVIHAAGIEISKDLGAKDRAQFDLVVGVKKQGWEALMAATADDPLAFLVGFGSVAGRFGNIGQVDYAAANEWLAKAIKAEAAARGAPTAFTIAWGPWGEVGMATRGSILQIMEASGVTPIPTEEGVRRFMSELARPGIRECVVAGRLGAIDTDGQVVAALPGQTAPRAEHPLLEEVTSFEPGRRLVATVVVDRERDPYLDDHSIDGVPYMPGVFGIEAFAQAAALLVPDAAFLGAQDVAFASPLKQLKGAVTATLEAEVVAEEPEALVRCRLTTRFVAPDGKTYGEPRLHFEGTMRFGAPQEAPEATAPACSGEVTRIYPPFFHGPSFQVLASAGPLDDDAVARYRPPTEAHFAAGSAAFLSHPMRNEALFQLCGLRTLATQQVMSLPFALESLDVHDATADDVTLVARPTGTVDGHRVFDAEAVTADGRIAARMTGFAMIETGPASDAAHLASPTGEDAPTPGEADPANGDGEGDGSNGHGTHGNGTHGNGSNGGSTARPAVSLRPPVALAPTEDGRIPEADVSLPELDAVAFAAVPVTPDAAPEPSWFSDEEIQECAALHAPNRRDDWRAGRLAVKAAVLKASPGLDPCAVRVRHEPEAGYPILSVDGHDLDVVVTITHRDGIALAAVAEAPIGVDLEPVEPREEPFVAQAFSADEQARLGEGPTRDLEVTCMWAAKEAAFKRARTGLKADLRAHEVEADGAGGAVVRGPLGTFGIRFFDIAGRVLAVSHPTYDQEVTAHA